jgi:hypothetical protein
VDEQVSESMVFETATIHALSDTTSIRGEHWFIEAILIATGVTKRQWVDGDKISAWADQQELCCYIRYRLSCA